MILWQTGTAALPVKQCRRLQVSMLMKVVEIQAVTPFRILVRFNDGATGVHDCAKDIAGDGPILAQMHDPNFFGRVTLEFGAPTWPSSFDMCPDWLRMEMEAAGEIGQGHVNAAE